MLSINEVIVVEGKYDKIKLSSVVDSIIISTNGFAIFKDKEKCELIRIYARKKGIIILTDSDTAGFKIRNYIKGFVNEGKITNVYIPDIFGKEKRKVKPSKEGKLGVEGVCVDVIIDSFKKAGVLMSENQPQKELITRMDLYEDGLSGGQNSSILRRSLLKKLDLPELLSTSSLIDILNSMLTRSEYKNIIEEITLNKIGE